MMTRAAGIESKSLGHDGIIFPKNSVIVKGRVNCDPQNGGNIFAQGCPGNGQWTYPSPGVVCNKAAGSCTHMAS